MPPHVSDTVARAQIGDQCLHLFGLLRPKGELDGVETLGRGARHQVPLDLLEDPTQRLLGDSRLEAELLVPVPDGAAVRGFDFSGPGKEPSAELLPKDQAKATYKSIVAKIKDPALLDAIDQGGRDPKSIETLRAELDHLLVSRAKGDAGRRIKEAGAYRATVVSRMEADVEQYRTLLPEYQRNPMMLINRLWEETKQQILSSGGVTKLKRRSSSIRRWSGSSGSPSRGRPSSSPSPASSWSRSPGRR